MVKLTKAMCWEVISITNDSVNGVGIAVYKKPTSNDCYEQRSKNDPPLCQKSDDPNAAWCAFLSHVFYMYQKVVSFVGFMKCSEVVHYNLYVVTFHLS